MIVLCKSLNNALHRRRLQVVVLALIICVILVLQFNQNHGPRINLNVPFNISMIQLTPPVEFDEPPAALVTLTLVYGLKGPEVVGFLLLSTYFRKEVSRLFQKLWQQETQYGKCHFFDSARELLSSSPLFIEVRPHENKTSPSSPFFDDYTSHCLVPLSELLRMESALTSGQVASLYVQIDLTRISITFPSVEVHMPRNQSDLLDLLHSKPVEELSAVPKPGQFVMCFGPIFSIPTYNEGKLTQTISYLIEYLEYLRWQGASHVYLYIENTVWSGDDQWAHPLVRAFFRFYGAQTDFLTMIDYSALMRPPWNAWYHGQLHIVTHCLHRAQQRPQLVFFSDIDEIPFSMSKYANLSDFAAAYTDKLFALGNGLNTFPASFLPVEGISSRICDSAAISAGSLALPQLRYKSAEYRIKFVAISSLISQSTVHWYHTLPGATRGTCTEHNYRATCPNQYPLSKDDIIVFHAQGILNGLTCETTIGEETSDATNFYPAYTNHLELKVQQIYQQLANAQL